MTRSATAITIPLRGWLGSTGCYRAVQSLAASEGGARIPTSPADLPVVRINLI